MARGNLIISFIFLMLGVFISHASQGANFSSTVIDFAGMKIRSVKITGQIYEGDNDKFSHLVDKYNDSDIPVELVVLNSIGGDVRESTSIVETILENDISTMVLPGSKCISACFSLFAAGAERVLYPGSIVGIHRATIENGEEDIDAKMATIATAKLYDILEVPRSIIKKMMITPPDKIYYLTQHEMKIMSTEQSQFETTSSKLSQDELDMLIENSLGAPVSAAGNY